MKSPPWDEEQRAEPGREMLIEVIGLHAQAMLRMPWVQSCLVLGLGLCIFTHVDARIFVAWSAVTIGMEFLRAHYARYVLKRGHDVDPRRTHAVFVALAAASGASIAVGVVLFLPRLPILYQALYGAVLFAIPAAGIAVSQSSRNILAAYATCMLLPAAVTWGVVYPSQAFGVGALTVLYCVVIILVAADGEKLLLRSVTIRHQRDRLVRDLEQRNADVRAAMGQAEQSAKARARVLAAASHDLRQPLHALSVYSAVLASRPAPDLLNEVSVNIDQIVRALGNLLNGLLDLSRLSAGNFVPEHQQLSLDTLIAGVCTEYQQAAAHKGLTLVQELQPVRIMGDAVAVGRIARNLIDNAIKYTDAGQVRVLTRIDGAATAPMAVLSVCDTGKGIPAAEQAKIFEEFYQLDNPGRDRSKGVGLGLAIVQRLCELLGAHILVESTLGEGTEFRVTMPAMLGSPVAAAGADAVANWASLEGRRCYVVDDERDIRNSMRALLGVWGVQTSTADSAQEAEALFAQHGSPDLLIVDLRLAGEEHGAHLADRLQKRHGAFPVLIITGETSSDALRDAQERGYMLLQKPIAAEVLRRSIINILGAR
jgi:signal transduction histidine kinase/CheY-like chemotaxis protein